MSDNEKYVFRLYNIGVPNKHANEYFGKDMSNKVYLGSPYVNRSADVYNEDNYREIGETIYDSQFDDVRQNKTEDRLVRPDFNMDSFADGKHYVSQRGNLILPHKGLSVISLADPFFSFYRPSDMVQDPVEFDESTKDIKLNLDFLTMLTPDTRRKALDVISEYTGTKFEHILQEFPKLSLDDMRKKINFDIDHLIEEYGSDIIPLNYVSNINHTIKNHVLDNPGLISPLYTDFNNFIKRRGTKNDFGYSKGSPYYSTDWGVDEDVHIGLPYEQLLRRIIETQRGTSANGLVLASVPKSAFYNIQDVIKGDLRAQRNYPEELVVKQLTPRKIFSVNTKLGHQPYKENHLTNIGRFRYGGKNHINLEQLIDFMNAQYKQGRTPEDVNEFAKDIIHTTFDIDPTKISDENKKFIFDDLSNWYKGYSDKKESKHNNIINGIKELGQ